VRHLRPDGWQRQPRRAPLPLPLRELGAVEGMDHPANVYVREDAIVPKLDVSIAGLFAPELFCKRGRKDDYRLYT
jgi:hypothetical protein